MKMIRKFLFLFFFFLGISLISILFLPSLLMPIKVVLTGGKIMGKWSSLCLQVFLKRAKLYPDLASALEKSITNSAFSARSRRASIPIFSVDESITHVMNNPNKTINLVFGNESSGLSNNDLLLCDYIVSLPTHNDYTSLNLSAAVQIITYELHKKSFVNPSSIESHTELATSKEKNFFINSLISLLENTKFITSKNHLSLKKKIHILFNRSNLEKEEVNMLMGMISSITKKFNK